MTSIWPDNFNSDKVRWNGNSGSHNAPVPTGLYQSMRQTSERERGLDILHYADSYVQICNTGRKSNPTRRTDVMIDFDKNLYTLVYNYAFTSDLALEIVREEYSLSETIAIDPMERRRYIRSTIERIITLGEKSLAEMLVNPK